MRRGEFDRLGAVASMNDLVAIRLKKLCYLIANVRVIIRNQNLPRSAIFLQISARSAARFARDHMNTGR
jgi:hypothetical protein